MRRRGVVLGGRYDARQTLRMDRVLDSRCVIDGGLADAAEVMGEQGETYSCGAWWNGYGVVSCVFLQATSSGCERGVVEEEDAESGWVKSLMKGKRR